MFKKISLLLFLFISKIALYATSQIPDYLIIGENTYFIQSNPLERFFDENPDLRPKGGSTALWRGYIATFELIGNQFFVVDIEIESYDFEKQEFYRESVMNDIFQDKDSVILSWFSGILVAPRGKIVNYVHMGYGSTYEEYLLFQIKDGSLKEERLYSGSDYETFRAMQFEEFKMTDEYKRLYDQSIEEGDEPGRIERFLYFFMIRYTSEFLVDRL